MSPYNSKCFYVKEVKQNIKAQNKRQNNHHLTRGEYHSNQMMSWTGFKGLMKRHFIIYAFTSTINLASPTIYQKGKHEMEIKLTGIAEFQIKASLILKL